VGPSTPRAEYFDKLRDAVDPPEPTSPAGGPPRLEEGRTVPKDSRAQSGLRIDSLIHAWLALNFTVNDFHDFKRDSAPRHEYFEPLGCVISRHALPGRPMVPCPDQAPVSLNRPETCPVLKHEIDLSAHVICPLFLPWLEAVMSQKNRAV